MEESDIIKRELKQFKLKQFRNIFAIVVAIYLTRYSPIIVKSEISKFIMFGGFDLYLIYFSDVTKEEDGNK